MGENQTMQVRSSKSGTELIITLSGEIDQIGSEELKKHLSGINMDNVSAVSLDFKDVTYIGSAGVGKLLLLYKKLPSDSISVNINGLTDELMSIFKEMELDSVFNLNR
jgi:anti-sigma B factor antagonist